MPSASSATSWAIFVPYGGMHAVTLLVCGTLVAAFMILGRRLRTTPAEPWLRNGLAGFALVAWIVSYLWLNWNKIEPYEGLPLHVCGLLGLIAPLALLTSSRWLRATMYFWTFTLTLQAFIQPVLIRGPATPEFWRFWTLHSLIAACAIYDLAVRNFRPDWGDFARASLVSIAYVALIIPVNLWIGANYGFVGNPPPNRAIPPLIAWFGPWPDRVLVVMALAALGYLLVLMPWRLAGARRRSNRDTVVAGDGRA